jgi:DNA-binding NarL/FixJ family response regulator
VSEVGVVVADAQPIMGLGLAEALRALGYTVLARVENADQLVLAVERCQPAFVLVDLALPGIIPAVATICSSGAHAPQVVLLAEPGQAGLIVAGVCAGAVGSVPRSVCPEPLRKALMAVQAGESLIPRALVPDVLAELRLRAESTSDEPSSHISVLTTRERQVLEMMRAGMSTTSIAEQLVVAPVTVRTHICAIRRKLHLRDGGLQHMSPLRAS